ncbi:hypothetical protein HD806DRAFT_529371 [Xylariaceae sp. AK1471]|nr:hypothetical protein HD806DRAFT_529371 [Xylariaceae sp. AK1471]
MVSSTPIEQYGSSSPQERPQQIAAKSARLAQSVERETLNLKVAGSTPALGSIPNAS